MSTLPFPAEEIHRADLADITPLACLIAEAFHSLAPSVWLVPDQQARREIYPKYFETYVQEAFEHGFVDIIEDLSAVALWIENPGTAHTPDPGDDASLSAITGSFAPNFQEFDRQLAAHHPTGTAHHHLAILAVHPKHQHLGMGTALLTRHHRDLDQGGIPAYLEASDESTRRLYLQHGYADLDTGPILLPDGPALYPMWRTARPV